MNITKATIKDLETIASLFDAYRVFYEKEPDLEGAKVFLSDRLKNNESVIYLAQDDASKGLGFIQLYPLFSSTRMSRLWLLNDLFVSPAARRQGIAKLLLERAKQHCKETSAAGFFLETGVENKEGNALYPTVGMTLNDDHNFYYWDVVD